MQHLHARLFCFSVLAAALFLSGCSATSTGDSGQAGASTSAASGATNAADELDPNSLQAINERAREREALPGRAHYEASCAFCHEGEIQRAPHREMLILMTPESVLQAMTTGLMATQAAGLTDIQKREVAEYIGGRPLGEVAASYASCDVDADAAGGERLNVRTQNWGFTPDNKRHLGSDITSVTKDNASGLTPKWAFAFNGANRARSQPLFVGDMLVTGSHNGEVLALDQDTGCVRWTFQASSEVRTAIVSDEAGSKGDQQLYFGDVLGNAYAISAHTGELAWRTRVDDHPNATITGTPSLFEDRLYVPVSALEVSSALDPLYECCTFRGSVVAMDRRSGKIDWQTFTLSLIHI